MGLERDHITRALLTGASNHVCFCWQEAEGVFHRPMWLLSVSVWEEGVLKIKDSPEGAAGFSESEASVCWFCPQ